MGSPLGAKFLVGEDTLEVSNLGVLIEAEGVGLGAEVGVGLGVETGVGLGV